MNNASSSYWQQYETAMLALASAVCMAVDIFILLSNILVMLTFKKLHLLNKLRLQHYYMIGLIGTDLMVFGINAIVTVILLLGKIWITETVCFWLACLLRVQGYATSMIHIGLSIDRWTMVIFPVKYRNLVSSSRFHTLAKHSIWLIHIVFVTLLFIMWNLNKLTFYFHPHISYFLLMSTRNNTLLIVLAKMFVHYILPLLIEIVLNVHIVWKITLLKGANCTRILKAVRTTLVTVGVYYVCLLPTLFNAILSATTTVDIGWFSFACIQIVFANSGMSCVIYYFTLPDFQNSLQAILKSICSC